MNKIACPLNGKTILEFPEIITAEDARKYTGKFNNIPYNVNNAYTAKRLAELIDDAVKLGFKCAEYPDILAEDFKNDLESKKFKVIHKTMIIWGDDTSILPLKENEFLSKEDRDDEYKKQCEKSDRVKAEKTKKEDEAREERIKKLRDEFPKNVMKSEGAGNSGCLLLLTALIIVPILGVACYLC